MCQIGEASEVALKDDVLLPGAVEVLGTVAHLTAMTARGIDMADKLCVIGAVVLDDTRALQQATLVGLALEVMTQATLDNTFQVAGELAHLASAEEHVGRAVVIEEQGGIVEVAQTGVDGPRSFSLRSGKDIGIAHGSLLVGSQECPELTIVVFQRGGPLAAAVDGTLLQVVLRRVSQFVEDIAHGLPVLQVLGGHDRCSRHEVHSGGDEVEGVADANDIGVGHVGPQHGILDTLSFGLQWLILLGHCAHGQQ